MDPEVLKKLREQYLAEQESNQARVMAGLRESPFCKRKLIKVIPARDLTPGNIPSSGTRIDRTEDGQTLNTTEDVMIMDDFGRCSASISEFYGSCSKCQKIMSESSYAGRCSSKICRHILCYECGYGWKDEGDKTPYFCFLHYCWRLTIHILTELFSMFKGWHEKEKEMLSGK